jgi:hypothetical protein
MYNYLCLFFAR